MTTAPAARAAAAATESAPAAWRCWRRVIYIRHGSASTGKPSGISQRTQDEACPENETIAKPSSAPANGYGRADLGRIAGEPISAAYAPSFMGHA